MGPADVQQLLILILFIVPGVVFQATRSRLRGPTPDDLDASGRVLRALGTSAFLAVVYVLILGNRLTARATGTSQGFGGSPRDEAGWAALLIFVIPVLLALGQHAVVVRARGYAWSALWKNFLRYDVVPTAWDKASVDRPPCYVRILTGDGRWVGGLAGPQSFISAYPEGRDIFLDEAWELGSDGAFIKPVNGTLGMWVRCDDARVVQMLTTSGDGPTPPGADVTPGGAQGTLDAGE